MKSVGIEIGSASIKLIELESSSRLTHIVRFQEFPLAPTATSDQELERIEILRGIAEQYDLVQTRFTVGLSQDFASVKYRVFPFRDRQKIAKSLPFELEDEVPLPSDELAYDHKVIAYRGQQTELLAVATPKADVLKLLSLCQDSGIDVDVISLETFALANLFENWKIPTPELPALERIDEGFEQTGNTPIMPSSDAVMYLHMGHKHSMLLVLREGRLISTRNFYWGALDIAEKLASVFSIPTLEALKALPTKGFILINNDGSTNDQKALSHSIALVINELIRELQLAITEIKTQHNLQILRMDILGGASQIKNLAPYLTQKLEIPVNLANPFDEAPHISISQNPNLFTQGCVALGLAIEGLKRGPNAFNLRRLDLQKKNHTFEKLWTDWAYTVKLAAALFVVFFIYSIYRESITTDLRDQADENLREVAQKVAHLNKKQSSPNGVRNHIKSQEARIRNSETLAKLQGVTGAMDLVKRISDGLPASRKGIGERAQPFYEIKTMDVEFSKVVIQGLAFDSTILGSIESALKSMSQSIKRVTPSIASEPRGSPFAFEMQVERIK